jgi:hypothetical protein
MIGQNFKYQWQFFSAGDWAVSTNFAPSSGLRGIVERSERPSQRIQQLDRTTDRAIRFIARDLEPKWYNRMQMWYKIWYDMILFRWPPVDGSSIQFNSYPLTDNSKSNQIKSNQIEWDLTIFCLYRLPSSQKNKDLRPGTVRTLLSNNWMESLSHTSRSAHTSRWDTAENSLRLHPALGWWGAGWTCLCRSCAPLSAQIEGCMPTQMSEKREVTGGEVRERTRVTDEFVLYVGNRLINE